jgi:phenylalanyl-tRNA synthetase beta chain
MRIPLSWLREYVDVAVTPERLADDLTVIGLEAGGVEKREGEAILDLDITTNRVDCMNLYGVAREVALLYGSPLRPLNLEIEEGGSDAREALRVTVDAPDLCPRFCARVLDVKIGPSPRWLAQRLEAVGVRPINSVVDVTNYVMLEMGHPTHAFDLARIPGAELRIRWAREGESLTTLDGVERTLTARCGIVGDGAGGGLGLAGVMGGASSEVSEETRVVALEAAYWNPLAVRRAARDAGVKTEASHRFERGADPEAPPQAMARIVHLLGQIGAGSVRPGLIDARPVGRRPRVVVLRPSRIDAILGTGVPTEREAAILQGLGFREVGQKGDGRSYEVPSWRGDVAREVDLVEEIGRHFGLDRIPARIPPARAVEGLRPAQRRERRVRDYLVGAGISEVISPAFASDARSAPLPDRRVRLENPISEEQDVLRRSIVIPGLLSILETNRRQGRRDVCVFEIGRVFVVGNPVPSEERRLGVLLAGTLVPPHWSTAPCEVTFFDVKGLVEGLGRRLGAGLAVRRGGEGLPPYLHPGRAALVDLDGMVIGGLGALHPDVAREWGVRDEVVVGEISLEALLARSPRAERYRPLQRFPSVSRDLSCVVKESVAASEVEAQVRGAAGSLLESLTVVDRYAGAPIPDGKVSLTLALRFVSAERTLTSEEVDAVIGRIVAALRSGGAEIRGE